MQNLRVLILDEADQLPYLYLNLCLYETSASTN